VRIPMTCSPSKTSAPVMAVIAMITPAPLTA
jgi:hypothetical protein